MPFGESGYPSNEKIRNTAGMSVLSFLARASRFIGDLFSQAEVSGKKFTIVVLLYKLLGQRKEVLQMMETFDYLNAYYSNYDEDGRLLSLHGQVEFLTTMRYIQRYLKLNMRILEVGAGTGRYTHTLARLGYAVDAVELIPHNIEVFQMNTQPGENITIAQGNALDLSAIKEESYDITLVLGPMYHLYTVEDALQALTEALRVTKKGGLVFVAYCISDATVIGYGFKDGFAPALLEAGLMDPETFKTYSTPVDLFQLHRKEDIDALMERFPVTRLHYVASDLFTNYMRETVDAMDEKLFALYVKYHFAVCEREDMVGITHHSVDIFRKNG